MQKLKIGVVGVGHIGREHARIYSLLDDVQFVGVFDIDPAVARSIAQQYDIRCFSTLGDMLESVDAVSVATPTSTHFEVAKPFLAAGRSVLMEKPIADSTEPARELVRMARANGAVLQIGHIERFNPVLRVLEDRLTRPRFIEAHRLSPYPGRSTDIGVVLDLMIHDLDVILHLVRSPISSIDAVGVAVLSRGEDIANARIRFENGCVANITTSRISPEKMRKIRVFQEDTYMSLDYQNQSGEIFRKLKSQIVRERVPVEKEEPLRLELQSFTECARARREPVVSGEQGTAALDVAIEITDRIWAGERGGASIAANSRAEAAGSPGGN
ncbi:MAG TPA: Gfo/Idh/MocA family oxidoreductase [Verrucomicrobiae bacterium]|nr:Gfo/Idh/MocA family oxidoreductase [Verrucomicrobiae bacterium]